MSDEGAALKLYLELEGKRWRVYDADYKDFRTTLRTLGAADAQSRYFVSEDGVRRLYQFKKGDSHSLELANVLRHFGSSGWAAKDRFESGSVKPT